MTLEREVASGINFDVRPGTSDVMMVHSIINGDEYHLKGRNLSGWAIDLGAHIGVAAAYMLSENPDLSVIAIEPVPGNVELLRSNLAPFGERAFILEAAAGLGTRVNVFHDYTADDDGYTETNRFIGALWRGEPHGGTKADVPAVTLAGVLEAFDISEVALLKTDCEGAEYDFLSDPEANAKVQVIVGEYHDDATAGQKIVDTLMFTHDVRVFERGVTGLFEATLS